MCGICGFFLKKTKGRQNFQEKKAFIEQGLYMNALRGWDATGLAMIGDPAKIPIVFKKAMPACDFISLKQTQKLVDNIDDYQAVLGHCRSATLRGNAQNQNAHPFQFDHITLIHNGHVNNWRALGAQCDIDVDSAHVAAAMAQNGEQDTLERIQGDYALVWHNAKDQTVNFTRNAGRPLHFVELPEWGGIAFASEYEMLGCLLSRNGIKISKDKFRWPVEHIHFKFDLTKELVKTTTPFRPESRRSGGGGKKRDTGRGTSGDRGQDRMRTLLSNIPIVGINKELAALIEKHNNKKPNKGVNSGRPTSIKGENKAKEKLSTLGLQYNELLGCQPMKFVPYKNNENLGMAVVSMVAPKFQGVLGEVQNITSEVYDAISDEGRYILARAVNVKVYDERRSIVFELDPEFVKNAIENYEYELNLAQRQGVNLLRYEGPGGRQISHARFLELTKHGCSMCEEPINSGNHTDLTWVHDSPICAGCMADADTVALLGLTQEDPTSGRKNLMN